VTPFHLLPEVLSDVDFAPAKATEPPKRWLNWWDYEVRTRCSHCGVSKGPGLAPTCAVFPSKDIAESRASLTVERNGPNADWAFVGSYPEGQRP